MTGPPNIASESPMIFSCKTSDCNVQVDNLKQGQVADMLTSIDAQIASYADRLKHHPIKNMLIEGNVPHAVLQEFAVTQYRECLLWVPMLALMKDHAQYKRMKRALRANMLCEAGAAGTSHVELCRRFVESMGVKPNSVEFSKYGENLAISFAEFGYITTIGEAETAGWILAAEELTPVSFALFLNGYKHVPGADLKYLTEHVTVDCDEHAKWMREGVEEMLSNDPSCINEILTGVHAGAHAVLRIPDVLYAKSLTQRGRHSHSGGIVQSCSFAA